MRRRRRHLFALVLLALFVLPVVKPEGFPAIEGWFDGALHWTSRFGPSSSSTLDPGSSGSDVDATRASMPTVEVSREWTRFFSVNQKDLKRVSVLVGSKSVELTIAIAQHLSQTGKLIQIYSDEEIYAARKAQAVKR